MKRLVVMVGLVLVGCGGRIEEPREVERDAGEVCLAGVWGGLECYPAADFLDAGAEQ